MAAALNVAISGSLDPVSYRNLQRDLARLEPEIRKELNAKLRGVGGGIVSAAQSNASWSTRIPGAISLSVTSTRVGVKVNRRRAPHARAYEGITGGSQFRHPVFGNRNVWITQTTRPSLAPAVRDHQAAFADAASDAVADAARAVGWR